MLVEKFGIRYNVGEFFDHLRNIDAVNFAENARRNARFVKQHRVQKMLRPDGSPARVISHSHSGAEHIFNSVRVVRRGGEGDVRRKNARFETRIHAVRRKKYARARAAYPNHSVQNMLRTDLGTCVLTGDRTCLAEYFVHIFGYRKLHYLTSLSYLVKIR